MQIKGSRLGLFAATLFWCGWIALSGTSTATFELQKQAKAAGIEVKNCQHCHVDALPKKEKHDFNDVGKWLVAEKEKRGAKQVDGGWLKDYPGAKK
jgi:alkyl sulfatase BDS1-like metallo-beta-lactamase superfamily hydrolase